jgi:hypothetical protein
MTRTRLIGLALTAALAVLAVACASASASTLQWLLNGKPITKALSVNSSGKPLLADLSAPSGGTYLECTGTGKGTVGPGGKGEAISATASSCTFQPGKNGACTASDSVTASPVHLPWLAELGSGKVSGTGGNPGWSVTCTVAGIIKVADECTGTLANPQLTNVAGGVDATSSASETASCTQGTASSGMVIGTGLVENPAGGTLSVSPG